MEESRLGRRRVLGVLAAGIGVGGAGCTGGDSTNGGDSSTTATSETTRSSTRSTTAATAEASTATRQSTGSDTTAGDVTTTTTASGTPATTTRGATERGEYTVGMYTDLYFDPIGLFVEPGETVSFELVSGVHSATAYHPENEGALGRRIPRGAPSWNTDVFSEVGTFRNVTFETQGTHDYYCIPHKYRMVGRIVVGEPGGPATESPNPDGGLPDSERIVEQGSIPYEEFQSSSR